MNPPVHPSLQTHLNPWLESRVVQHALFWVVVLGLNFLIQLPAHFAIGTKLYISGLFFNQLPAALLTIYPLLYGLLPRLLRRQQLLLTLALLAGWVGFTVVVTGLTRAFFDFVVQPGLFGIPPRQAFSWDEYLMLSYTWFVLMATAGAAVAVKVMNGWYAQRQLQQALLQRQLRTELQLLKAQLQPTFLFNTLRTLHGLTARKAPESPAAVLHLSALLRYLLYESPLDTVPLADEAEMMRCYVALEKLRLGARVDVALSVSGALDAHRIPPLLLLPFLENAFRHGTGPGLECPWVSLDLVAKKNSVIFKVINSQAGAEHGLREGPGLRSIRQRLARLYPGRHELKIVSEPDTFLIALHLQLAPAALPAAQPAPEAPSPAARQPASNQQPATRNPP
ncbi:sensor histidine kinase [Hymenobacter sp.]|uniref:sensor histidine kinase n=1 Tax=Hymenobacter sp. TaxID=1898978 RepID=UPI00286C2735|nr:sensor histidine kinase [Hymenobacter sp.]